MANSKRGRKLHQLAEVAREQGKFQKALEYTDQATIAYTQDKDYLGLAEVQSSRQSTLKHLFRKTGDDYFLILEKHSAEAAVEIAKKSKIADAMAIPYHNLGKYYQEKKDFKKAAFYFRKAADFLEKFPNPFHTRPSVIADIRGHQFAAEYEAGDKTALSRAQKALEDLKKSKEESYNKNVWITGAYLRNAQMLKKDNFKLAARYLNEAEAIINSDKRLILRKSQLQKLKKQI